MAAASGGEMREQVVPKEAVEVATLEQLSHIGDLDYVRTMLRAEEPGTQGLRRPRDRPRKARGRHPQRNWAAAHSESGAAGQVERSLNSN